MIFKADKLEVRTFPDRKAMGEDAAGVAAEGIMRLLEDKGQINIVFAAAPSQNDFLSSLAAMDLPWDRINAFHMDEYIGLPDSAPQRFAHYLDEHIFSLVPFRSVNYMKGESPEEVCRSYSELLKACPPDAVFMGIGENGHIAFNDPHVAYFDDPETVKVVNLDEVCRLQQVHDGCFPTLEDVPRQAATVTIPVMMGAKLIICVVPCLSKAMAVRRTVRGPVETACPASILRRHPNATMFCDSDSASLL